jgi:large subunit ribosomal protein L31
MKTGIHPEYTNAQVTCACGNTFVTRSVRPVLKIEICSACHPFYTGQQKLVDTAGRVERFQKRFAKTGGKTIKKAVVKVAAKASAALKPGSKTLSTSPTHKAKTAKPKAKAKGE